ncbi:MAG: adenylate/guanylate cyclase domain-containing protein [Alphaproteobacteria bacterium]|nr:adenylate/guanylate cyclase domain-containing protein [Alphaproteobacteria bacterium]
MQMQRIARHIQNIIPALVLLLAFGLNYYDPFFIITNLRNQTFDLYQRIKPREYVDPAPIAGVGIKLIDVDDESLSRIGQWPWPRTIIADLIARATNAGAYAIVFDVVFAEPDRTSPQQFLTQLGNSPRLNQVAQIISAMPDHDDVLADVMRQANVVTGFTLTEAANGFEPERKSGFSYAGDDPRQFIPSFNGAVTNLNKLEKASAGNGSFNFITEQDNIIRRVPLLVRKGETLYPTLVMEALRIVQGASTFIVKSSGANMTESFGEKTGITAVKVGRIEVPTTSTGQAWLHYTSDVPSRRIPAWKIFEENFDPSLIAGNILFVGPSAAGLKDLRATPLNPVTAGVEVHIQLLEQILLGHFLSRPDWAEGAEIVFLISFGVVILIALRQVSALACALVAASGITFAVGASWYLYSSYQWLLDPIGPSLTVGLMFISGTLLNFLRTEAEKAQVRGAFAQYLSPALVEQLANDPTRLKLGGETRDMTFLFCDVRGFTTISEQFKGNPQGLTSLINRFLTPMTDIILEKGGTIDKYMGDCIMAFWNAPLDVPNHAEQACSTSLQMYHDLEFLNQDLKAEAEREDRPYFPLKIGIGLNTGDCVVGNMGSEQRFDYSVLGDAVNLASRLESQSKNYGADIVIGELTYTSVKDVFAFLELDLIAVKGKTEAVRIFSLVGDRAMAVSDTFQSFRKTHDGMLVAYRSQHWEEAAKLVDELRHKEGANQTLYDMYAERIAEYQATSPGADWDGVYVAASK